MIGGDVVLATLARRGNEWLLRPSSGPVVVVADDIEVWAIVYAIVRTDV